MKMRSPFIQQFIVIVFAPKQQRHHHQAIAAQFQVIEKPGVLETWMLCKRSHKPKPTAIPGSFVPNRKSNETNECEKHVIYLKFLLERFQSHAR